MLAFGDSITNGGGELQWGVALQSWALWVARGLGLPYTGLAVDGAAARDVVGAQIPAYVARAPIPGGPLRPRLPLRRRQRRARAGLGRARLRRRDSARRSATSPTRCDAYAGAHRSARPRAPGTRAGGSTRRTRSIAAEAAAAGALVLDLGDFGARNHVMADHVHPTAFGQIAIAERALAVLGRDGLPTARGAGLALIAYETTRWGRLRGDVTYVYRRGETVATAIRRPDSRALRRAGPA